MINATGDNIIDLNNYTDCSYYIVWNYDGCDNIMYGGKKIQSSAGCVLIFPNMEGCTQIYFRYSDATSILMRVYYKYSNAWSSWYRYIGQEAEL